MTKDLKLKKGLHAKRQQNTENLLLKNFPLHKCPIKSKNQIDYPKVHPQTMDL
jgi:hypothetical protein